MNPTRNGIQSCRQGLFQTVLSLIDNLVPGGRSLLMGREKKSHRELGVYAAKFSADCNGATYLGSHLVVSDGIFD
jgi:hypothetical protein